MTHHGIFIALAVVHRGHDDIEVLPNVLLELAYIHALSTFRVVNRLGAHTTCLPRRGREQILLLLGRSRTSRATVAVEVVEPWRIVEVVVEKLRIERDRAAVLRWVNTDVLI